MLLVRESQQYVSYCFAQTVSGVTVFTYHKRIHTEELEQLTSMDQSREPNYEASLAVFSAAVCASHFHLVQHVLVSVLLRHCHHLKEQIREVIFLGSLLLRLVPWPRGHNNPTWTGLTCRSCIDSFTGSDLTA